MRHHHSPGIRGQLMWFLCCICLFLLALVWFLSTQLLEPLYTKHIEKQLTTQAESITAELDKAIANGEALSAWSFGHLTVNTAFFDRLATQLYASGSLNSFCVDISDTTMRTIYKIENQSYCNLHETLLSDSANNDMIVSTAVAMRKKCRTTGGFVQTLNPPRLSGSAQLLVGRNTSGGEYTVLVTTSLVHVAEAGKVLSTVLPMAAALIFAFAMTAAWLFSEWFTKPLRQLSSAARQMAMGNYAVQVDTRRSDELGDLARDFNHMASEVQHSSQMQRDLLANVSHDLRTPLTLIKGYAETVRDITGDDKAHRDEQMNIIVDETDRLTALVSSVMELSKVTSGADKCERVHFDMGQLCDEVSERYDAICAQNGWQLQLELPAVLGADGIVPFAHLVAQLAHIKVHALAFVGTAGHLAQLHHAGDQCGQAVGLVHDNVHLLIAVGLVVAGNVAHRLGIALDKGQRGAQVVGDVGQQVALHLRRMLHLACHVVEVPGQIAQLIAAAGIHLHGIVAHGHLAGSAGKLAQRLCEPLTEQPCRRHGKGKDQRRCHGQHGAQHLAGFSHMHKAGSDQNGVLAAGGVAPYQQLCRAGEPRRIQGLHKAAGGAAFLAHGHSGGNDHIVVGGIREQRFVQVAVGLVLDLIDRAHGGIGNIHTEAVQRTAGVQLGGKPVKKRGVDRKMAKRPCRKGFAVCNSLVQLGGDAFCLSGQLFFNVLGVQRFQQLGGQKPHQCQQEQTDTTQKPHQLAADAGGVMVPHESSAPLSARCVGVEFVADAPHGSNVAAALAQMAPQHFDMGIHGAVLAKVVVVPHLLQDLFTAEGDALVGSKEHQQVELLGGQGHLLAGNAHRVAGRVDGQLTKGHGVGGSGGLGHGAVQHGLDAGYQLTGREGLDNVVVGTALQAGQLVVFLAAGGQDDDRRVDVAGAHLPQAGHTVHERHHQVQNDQIEGSAGKLGQRSCAVSGLFTDITGIL